MWTDTVAASAATVTVEAKDAIPRRKSVAPELNINLTTPPTAEFFTMFRAATPYVVNGEERGFVFPTANTFWTAIRRKYL